MIFQAFLNLFTSYFLNGEFVNLELVFCPYLLGATTWDFFCTIFLFVSSIGGHLCTLFLVFSSTSGFFNIFRLMLLAPIFHSTKLIFLDVDLETIATSS
jgi:hypothetical protein